MTKIVGSRLNFSNKENELIQTFFSYIEDILENEEFKKLTNFEQHINTNRLQHSMNVAYYTYLVCQKYNWHPKEATRAALLHDFFLYDWRETKLGFHPNEHPKQALINAKRYFEINPLMENMILAHMWPLSIAIPKHRESWVVQGADRYCACLEAMHGTKQKLKELRMITSITALFK